MKQIVLTMLTLGILLFICGTLFVGGSYVVYLLVYVFSFVFLLWHTVFSVSAILDKIAQALVYALIMASQILFDIFVIRILLEGPQSFRIVGKLSGIFLIFIPFLIKQLFFFIQHDRSPFTALGECTALSYSQLLDDKDKIINRIHKLKSTRQKLSKENVLEIIHDLPRHNSFSYINNGSLTEGYFQQAAKALQDGYIYLILTKSKSASSEMIGLFTDKPYNHVSLSFDRELRTIISYNGGEHITPPGLNPELVEQLARREGASILLYQLPATYQQKQIILDKIRTINREGSAYNLLGLLLKTTPQPNIMFCSQFVYTMLELVGLNYFQKDATHVTPTDFIELDYYRTLDFLCKINLNETNGSKQEA